MLATDIVLYMGKINLYEEDRLGKSHMTHRICVLLQNAIVFYPEEAISLVETREDARVPTQDITVYVEEPANRRSQFKVNIIKPNTKYFFTVQSEEEAEKWAKMITMSSSWANYETFCKFHKITPWRYLLDWAAKGEDELVLNLSAMHSIAANEFLKNNRYIRKLKIEKLNNQIPVLSKILSCFKTDQLLVLKLSSAHINDRTFGAIRNTLASHEYLRHLDLSHNLISGQSVNFLLKIFSCLPDLVVVNLAYNPIRDEGVKDILDQIFEIIEISTLDLTCCQLTDKILPNLLYVLNIKNLPLETLKLNGNEFSLNVMSNIYKKLYVKRQKGSSLMIEMNPIPINEKVMSVMEWMGDIKIMRILLNNEDGNIKPMPRLAKHRTTIDSMLYKLETFENMSVVYVEDILEIAKEIATLDFQFPKSKLKLFEELINAQILQAVETNNYYCLEKLIESQKCIGITDIKSQELFDDLKSEIEHIRLTLQNVLTPSLYTKDHIPEINHLLDSILKRADELGLKGELIRTAKLLQQKRDGYVALGIK